MYGHSPYKIWKARKELASLVARDSDNERLQQGEYAVLCHHRDAFSGREGGEQVEVARACRKHGVTQGFLQLAVPTEIELGGDIELHVAKGRHHLAEGVNVMTNSRKVHAVLVDVLGII